METAQAIDNLLSNLEFLENPEWLYSSSVLGSIHTMDESDK